jgi:hypothetical protein
MILCDGDVSRVGCQRVFPAGYPLGRTVHPNTTRQIKQRMLKEANTRMATPAVLAQSAHALLPILHGCLAAVWLYNLGCCCPAEQF